jgi:hypothetical protein
VSGPTGVTGPTGQASGYLRVAADNTYVNPPTGTTLSATVACPNGKIVVSGSFIFTGSFPEGAPRILVSEPDGTTEWHVAAVTVGAHPAIILTAQATCIDA